MTERNQDIELDAGDDFAFGMDVLDETGAALDLTSATIRYGLSAKASDPAPLVEKDSGALGGVVIEAPPTAGKITVSLDSADTVDLAGRYHHEVEVTLAGKALTAATGTATIFPTVLK